MALWNLVALAVLVADVVAVEVLQDGVVALVVLAATAVKGHAPKAPSLVV